MCSKQEIFGCGLLFLCFEVVSFFVVSCCAFRLYYFLSLTDQYTLFRFQGKSSQLIRMLHERSYANPCVLLPLVTFNHISPISSISQATKFVSVPLISLEVWLFLPLIFFVLLAKSADTHFFIFMYVADCRIWELLG